MTNATAKKTELATQTTLSAEEQKLIDKMKARASKAVSSMPPIMIIW